MRDTRTHGDTMAMGTPQCGDEGPHGHENTFHGEKRHHGHGEMMIHGEKRHHGHGDTPDMRMGDTMAVGVRDARTHGDTMAMGTPHFGDEGHHGHENMVIHGEERHHGHGVTPNMEMRDTMAMGR